METKTPATPTRKRLSPVAKLFLGLGVLILLVLAFEVGTVLLGTH